MMVLLLAATGNNGPKIRLWIYSRALWSPLLFVCQEGFLLEVCKSSPDCGGFLYMVQLIQMKNKRYLPFLFACSLILPLVALGCGQNNSENANVIKGKVTYKGTPVPGGKVELIPLKGQGSFTAMLKADGSYKIGGIPKGKMKIVVDTETVKNMGPQVDVSKMKPPPGHSEIPENMKPGGRTQYRPIPYKYRHANTTDLTVEITGGPQDHDIELK